MCRAFWTCAMLAFMCVAALCSFGADGLDKRWKAWQEYAKSYRASALFPVLDYPRGSDWLACHEEYGQTFEDYVGSDPVKLTKTRDRIVIQPVGDFTAKEQKMLDALRDYVALYFQCKVDLFDGIALPKDGFRKRSTGPQYLTGSILDDLLKPKLPADAACYIGVTCADIYPGPGWNFVFGQASLRDRVAVESLARYYPSFWGEPPPKDEDTVVLRRALKTLTHEIGHAFSVQHCTYFQCNMTGSNSLPESDRRPLHLCPVCLKKLQWNRGFDVARRERELLAFYKKHALLPEADWTVDRLKELEKP